MLVGHHRFVSWHHALDCGLDVTQSQKTFAPWRLANSDFKNTLSFLGCHTSIIRCDQAVQLKMPSADLSRTRVVVNDLRSGEDTLVTQHPVRFLRRGIYTQEMSFHVHVDR